MVTFDEYFEFIGARAVREREKQFAVEGSGRTETKQPISPMVRKRRRVRKLE